MKLIPLFLIPVLSSCITIQEPNPNRSETISISSEVSNSPPKQTFVEDNNVLDMADQFAECGAAFEVTSIISSALGEPEVAQSWHELSNGWLLAGFGLVYPLGYQMGYIEQQHKAQVNKWKAMLVGDPEYTLNKMQQKIDQCKKYSDLQVEISKHTRRLLYKSQ